MKAATLAVAILLSARSLAADCSHFVVQHARGHYFDEPTFLKEATSLVPFSTAYVGRVSYQEIFPSGPAIEFNCDRDQSLSRETAQRFRSAIYWVTTAASYFRQRVPGENWESLAKMKKADANDALMKTFHYPPNFAKALANAIDDKLLRDKVMDEFSYVIRDGLPLTTAVKGSL